jgi:hypothetical protein
MYSNLRLEDQSLAAELPLGNPYPAELLRAAMPTKFQRERLSGDSDKSMVF